MVARGPGLRRWSRRTRERVIIIIIIIIIIIFFLPSVAYDPEGFQKLDRLQKRLQN